MACMQHPSGIFIFPYLNKIITAPQLCFLSAPVEIEVAPLRDTDHKQESCLVTRD